MPEFYTQPHRQLHGLLFIAFQVLIVHHRPLCIQSLTLKLLTHKPPHAQLRCVGPALHRRLPSQGHCELVVISCTPMVQVTGWAVCIAFPCPKCIFHQTSNPHNAGYCQSAPCGTCSQSKHARWTCCTPVQPMVNPLFCLQTIEAHLHLCCCWPFMFQQ